MKINYQKKLDETIYSCQQSGIVPTLLLHSCCAPCSSYVLEYLSSHFLITIFYYNPNIYPDIEYQKRVKEQQEFISKLKPKHQIKFIEGNFDPNEFYSAIKGLETFPEGSERCFACYHLRLAQTAKLANKSGFDFFTTTLSISPYKNAQKLNEIGKDLATQYRVKYLFSDFKKKNGYKRSIELSNEYGLYRQDYCGCVFSMKEVQNRKNSL